MKTKLAVIFLSLSISLMRKCFLVILIFSLLMQLSCRKDILEPTGPATTDNISTLGSATGSTYYVSTTGNDAASGDITHPWANMAKGI